MKKVNQEKTIKTIRVFTQGQKVYTSSPNARYRIPLRWIPVSISK